MGIRDVRETARRVSPGSPTVHTTRLQRQPPLMLRKPPVPDRYGCQTDDGIIVLDISSGKYYAVGGAAETPLNGRDFFRDHGIKTVDWLVDNADLVALEVPPASHSINLTHLLVLLSAILRVVIGRALFGTGALIRATRRLKDRLARFRTAQSDSALISAVRAFRQFRPWVYTAQDRCLFDALILNHYLLRLGFDAAIVIGIRTRPFEAHAWIQIGTLLVDDLPEKVKTFTPIVVV